MTTTYEMVVAWGESRGILASADPLSQLLKTIEELGELSRAVLKNDREQQVDGIGDTLVTIILVNEMLGGLPIEAPDSSNENFSSKAWVALVSNCVGSLGFWLAMGVEDEIHQGNLIGESVTALTGLATSLGLTMQECLDHAYSIINQRSGSMVNGVFVKSEAGDGQ